MIKKHRSNKKNQIRQNEPRQRLSDGLELPKDVSCGAAIVTVTGRRSLVLENYRGIVSYYYDLFGIKIYEDDETENSR